jgi:CHASE3 domain sensor protein
MSSASSSPQTVRLFVLGLLLPCLLLMVTAVMAFRLQDQQADSIHRVAHTLEVQRELQTLTVLLLKSESSQRGLLLGARVATVEDFDSSVNEIPRQLEKVSGLISDNPSQRKNLARLRSRMDTKLAFMQQVVASYRSGPLSTALAQVVTGRGKDLIEPILQEIHLMEQEESSLLALRQGQLAGRLHVATGLLTVLLTLNLAFVLAMLLLFRRLSRAQGIVTVCAWSRTVEYKGEWLSFEQYLLRRFHVNTSHGLSPAELEKALAEDHPETQSS